MLIKPFNHIKESPCALLVAALHCLNLSSHEGFEAMLIYWLSFLSEILLFSMLIASKLALYWLKGDSTISIWITTITHHSVHRPSKIRNNKKERKTQLLNFLLLQWGTPLTVEKEINRKKRHMKKVKRHSSNSKH